ncbi:hypothetical protein [Comamonas composti]|uniref:hypothetical protein n=1 Tax=Comamonas composti TaxID=408558 RepID=UPI001B7FCF5B|nr:hypothetical protein [Comamonas composti]
MLTISMPALRREDRKHVPSRLGAHLFSPFLAQKIGVAKYGMLHDRTMAAIYLLRSMCSSMHLHPVFSSA